MQNLSVQKDTTQNRQELQSILNCFFQLISQPFPAVIEIINLHLGIEKFFNKIKLATLIWNFPPNRKGILFYIELLLKYRYYSRNS